MNICAQTLLTKSLPDKATSQLPKFPDTAIYTHYSFNRWISEYWKSTRSVPRQQLNTTLVVMWSKK